MISLGSEAARAVRIDEIKSALQLCFVVRGKPLHTFPEALFGG
jgi:hypothetical protein